MHKILILTPVWRRPEIFEICLKGIKRIQQYKPKKFNIQPLFILSESKAVELVSQYGYEFIFVKNEPLGEKKNTGLTYALENFNFDYLMELGSDDIIINQYLELIEPYMDRQEKQFCLHNVYFIDTITGKTAYWETTRVLGAGRCIHRSAIEAVLKTKTPFWTPEKNRGMDTCSWRNLQHIGIKNTVIEVKEQCYSLDIKSHVNINTLAPFQRSPLSLTQILNHFPNEREDILALLPK
jgi:glycosyltransferase involved in cell wall biosynthesis